MGGTYRNNTKNNKNNMILTKRREQCLHGNLKCMFRRKFSCPADGKELLKQDSKSTNHKV